MPNSSTTDSAGDNGDGDIVGPKQIEPHSYGSGKGCVNAGDLGLGSVSVQINALKDFGNTDYCVLGYENLDCTGLMHVKHAINSDNANDRKCQSFILADHICHADTYKVGSYKFEKTILSAKITEVSDRQHHGYGR